MAPDPYIKTSVVFNNAVALGAIDGAFTAGAVVGTVLFLARGHTLPKRLTLIIAFTLVATRAWVLAPYPSLRVILATMMDKPTEARKSS